MQAGRRSRAALAGAVVVMVAPIAAYRQPVDIDPARRARAKAIRQDLLQAYDDDEACPPEWADLNVRIAGAVAHIERTLDLELERFLGEADIRVAVERRERAATRLRGSVSAVNEMIRRLNLITPIKNLQRSTLDADSLLRPLYRTRRTPAR